VAASAFPPSGGTVRSGHQTISQSNRRLTSNHAD
jgi:hypothetical protein